MGNLILGKQWGGTLRSLQVFRGTVRSPTFRRASDTFWRKTDTSCLHYSALHLLLQCDVSADHQDVRRSRMISSRVPRQRPFCRDDQVAKAPQKRKSSASANLSRKRKRSEGAGPSQPYLKVRSLVPKPRDPIPPEDLPAVSPVALSRAGPSQPYLKVRSLVPKPRDPIPPEDLPAVSPVALSRAGPSQPYLKVLSLVPKPRDPIPPEDLPAVSPVALSRAGSSQPYLKVQSLVPKPRDPIPPEDLPAVSPVALSFQPSRAPNHTVDESQPTDDKLWYKNVRVRSKFWDLGRQIKQELKERLTRPSLTTSVFSGTGLYPPFY
ncbi:uncharacterized protein PAE49_002368 isoform 1-T2 [Odontesthes bonariensis]